MSNKGIGGYVIVDFKGANIEDDGTKIEGLFKALDTAVKSNKPVLAENLKTDFSLKTTAYIRPEVSDGDYTFNIFSDSGDIINVTVDNKDTATSKLVEVGGGSFSGNTILDFECDATHTIDSTTILTTLVPSDELKDAISDYTDDPSTPLYIKGLILTVGGEASAYTIISPIPVTLSYVAGIINFSFALGTDAISIVWDTTNNIYWTKGV